MQLVYILFNKRIKKEAPDLPISLTTYNQKGKKSSVPEVYLSGRYGKSKEIPLNKFTPPWPAVGFWFFFLTTTNLNCFAPVNFSAKPIQRIAKKTKFPSLPGNKCGGGCLPLSRFLYSVQGLFSFQKYPSSSNVRMTRVV